jgi:hypothetical protein
MNKIFSKNKGEDKYRLMFFQRPAGAGVGPCLL